MSTKRRSKKKAESTAASPAAVSLSWCDDARGKIAPRTKGDAKIAARGWKPDWTYMKNILSRLTATTDVEELKEAVPKVAAWAERDSIPPDTTWQEIAVAMAVMWWPSTCEMLVERCGMPIVFEAALRGRLTSSYNQGQQVLTRPPNALPNLGLAVRKVLILSEDKVVAECKEIARPVWEKAPAPEKAAIAYAFAHDEEWRADTLRAIEEAQLPCTLETLSFVRDAEAARSMIRRATGVVPYVEIVACLGTDALPIILEAEAELKGDPAHQAWVTGAGSLACGEIAKRLAARISRLSTRATIESYFFRNPELGHLALPDESAGASRNAALAKGLLARLPGGTPATPVDLVPLSDPAVPVVLRDAPWKKPKRAAPGFGLVLPEYPDRVTLSEKDKSDAIEWLTKLRGSTEEMNEEEGQAYFKQCTSGSWGYEWISGKLIPEKVAFDLYVGTGRITYSTNTHLVMLAKYGVAALPGLMRSLDEVFKLPKHVFHGIDAARLALPLARIATSTSPRRAAAQEWLQSHRGAAYGLLCAMDGTPEERDTATLALRQMDANGGRDLILEAAAQGGERRRREGDSMSPLRDTKKEALAFLQSDPREDTRKQPAIPSTWKPSATTRPRLRDGRPLDDDAIVRIVEMVAASPLEPPYAGIADVRAACDPRSLAELAWDLAALADTSASARRRTRISHPDWMRWAVYHLGDEEVVRRLLPALKHETIYTILAFMALKGSHAARMELATALEDNSNAPHAFQSVADGLGMDLDALHASLIPTTTLSDEGTMTLEYGKRTLQVGFDTTLTPQLREGDERLGALPRAKKDDDPIAVRLAKETWDALKQDVATIAKLRRKTLEDAIRTGKKMPVATFLSGWANHPLAKHIARGLVWTTKHGSFRVAEDSSLADAEDRAFELRDDDMVGVAHPLTLGDKDKWLATFDAYAVLQPVPQLGRAPTPITDEELAGNLIQRPMSNVLYTGIQRALKELGFDNGRARQMANHKPTGWAVLELETKWTDRKWRVVGAKLAFVVADSAPYYAKDGIALSAVDPLDRFEALYALAQVLMAT